ncbi:DUF3231 family protein [Bacillus taeanensis]|uniref:DUF3231 domain-containing protein n=1 Tax=Bacillus taeanensis TaxID=273032 RepID=A0A366XPW6_9BACI|nr:DUF3231 family protein [Bacillus taeanensis]RBW67947.1 hypothetical protein DS031_19265 [Bacillus taeanensis]
MANNHHPKLTASETALLWGSYQNDTLGVCMISHFLQTVEDEEIRPLLQFALDIAKQHLRKLTAIFKEEKHPIPIGFTKADINLNAPKLFSDTFMLYYIQGMGAMGLNTYSTALPNAARKDIRDYYTSCLHSSSELYNRTSDLMQQKGVFIRAPYIPYNEKVEFVEKQHFLSGWIGDQRPLTSNEILLLFANLQRNMFGHALLTGFSQIAQSKEVKHYMTRGAEISKHHMEIFHKYLTESNVETPMTWNIMPTASTEPPFSDKLLMFHTTAINALGIGYYGASLAGTARKDISASYSRLMIEAGEYSADGANLMIKNGWLEKPPSAPDRKALVKS